jgi:hypothetical protein
MLKQAFWFFLILYHGSITCSAEELMSLVHLPDDLDQNFPFEVLEASKPKLTVKWVEPSKILMLPYPEGSYISFQQKEKFWNLTTQSIGDAPKDSLFKLWHRAGAHSDDPRWHDIPLKRKMLLALLCLPFAVLCYQARQKNHTFILGCFVLAIIFSPRYQHRIILHADKSWEISNHRLANWLKWENRPLIGLQVSQIKRPELEIEASKLGMWLAPEFDQLGQVDHLWHSQHHLVTLWRR